MTSKPKPTDHSNFDGKLICRDCLSTNIKTRKLKNERSVLVCGRCGSRNIRQGCPECGSTSISYDEEMEEIVCLHCGLVLAEAPPDYCDVVHLDLPWGILLHRIMI